MPPTDSGSRTQEPDAIPTALTMVPARAPRRRAAEQRVLQSGTSRAGAGTENSSSQQVALFLSEE